MKKLEFIEVTEEELMELKGFDSDKELKDSDKKFKKTDKKEKGKKNEQKK